MAGFKPHRPVLPHQMFFFRRREWEGQTGKLRGAYLRDPVLLFAVIALAPKSRLGV